MAETSYLREETLPPQYLADFMQGVPGENVPGIMPLLNQELVNRMMGIGQEGATPYTYTGQRIADFSPAEREAMQMRNGCIPSVSTRCRTINRTRWAIAWSGAKYG